MAGSGVANNTLSDQARDEDAEQTLIASACILYEL